MHPLPLGELSATPWSFSSAWFVVMALAIPALVWLALAWRRALLECPNRVRRAGVKEMNRLLKRVQRSGATPEPAHLRAWLRASARAWDVRTSAPAASEVTEAAYSISGDSTVSSRWRELWHSTEYCLYAANGEPNKEWVDRAHHATSSIEVPKRERLFPNRLGHWLPSIAPSLLVALFVIVGFASPSTEADVPWSAPPPPNEPVATTPAAEGAAVDEAATLEEAEPEEEAIVEPLAPEVGEAAQAALDANWNDWAAHNNLAAYQTQQGELNLAIAHATAAFVQHPAASTTRGTLVAALGETPGIDANLRRLLFGSWYQRMPTLLSPAAWQHLALVAGLLVAAGLSIMIFGLYVPAANQRLSWAARGGLAAGALLLIVAISGWNGYGALNQPGAAILVHEANASPVPTDLVPVEETSPLTAGTVVLTRRSFLGWREVTTDRSASGWIRDNAVMPLYAR